MFTKSKERKGDELFQHNIRDFLLNDDRFIITDDINLFDDFISQTKVVPM